MGCEDDGYSGASLIRPGLEALRDLAAQGQIEAALVHAPDRLSRKYPTKWCWARNSPVSGYRWFS